MIAKRQSPDNDMWPNLFVIGEPRCGTTTLHYWLSEHPDIYMATVKEPHYFSSIEFPKLEKDILRITKEEVEYLKLFSKGINKKYRGESSSYYLADPESPCLLKSTVPSAKLIAIFRDPVQRAFSHYLLYGRRGTQTKTFYEIVKYLLYESSKHPSSLVYDIVELGRYHKHIQNYFRNFSESQLLVLFFEDLKRDPRGTIERVCKFLNVDSGFSEMIQLNVKKNAYAVPRNILAGKLLGNNILTSIGLKVLPRKLLQVIRNDVLLRKSNKPVIDSEAKTLLIKQYEPEIDKLEKTIRRNCNDLRKSWFQPNED